MRNLAGYHRGHDLPLIATGKSDGAPEDQEAGGGLHFAFTIDDSVGVNRRGRLRKGLWHDEGAMLDLEAGREAFDYQARSEQHPQKERQDL